MSDSLSGLMEKVLGFVSDGGKDINGSYVPNKVLIMDGDIRESYPDSKVIPHLDRCNYLLTRCLDMTRADVDHVDVFRVGRSGINYTVHYGDGRVWKISGAEVLAIFEKR